ncbi:MAG: cbb3-type cytochrome c oxidase subunit I [Chromatiales bacterium]|jgi:nitric oxide reductase subunit B|nr:MAG: cbb3-type cytochrome c oxidase subunit I [Chromatiales bacterium]
MSDAGDNDNIGLWFILLGLLALGGGLVFGTIGAFQFLYPGFLEQVPFFKSRPLHVSLVVSWIFLAAVGGIYYYLPRHCGLKLFSGKLARLHFWLFLITGLAILSSYFAGRFGGREYWEFPAVLSIPIFVSWILFGINYFRTVARKRDAWPVYLWMWGTGCIFFLLTFSEAYLWLFPYFRETFVREITVQWKAYGALVGSWNMLSYGTAIFVMSRVSGDDKPARSRLAFALYLLGFTNLLFGWSHHLYPIPNAPLIRNIGYIVSMSELILLGKIIWDWRRTLSTHQKYRHQHAYRFLAASEWWIFLNLILALIISVPAANLITHGTHITVAHSMGSTIGINTMILLASVFCIIEDRVGIPLPASHAVPVRAGYWLGNGALLVFFAALIAAGLARGTYSGASFQEMMALIRPYLLVFLVSGVGLATGLLLILAPGIRLIYTLAFPDTRLVTAAGSVR